MVQVLNITDRSERDMEAVANARIALDIMSRELKNTVTDPALSPYFLGLPSVKSYGDGKDNDGDGAVDEETFNGRDDDGDYQAGEDDFHAVVDAGVNGPLTERRHGEDEADFGDGRVDEDCLFSQARLSFRAHPEPGASYDYNWISYALVDTFDEEDVPVLVRTCRHIMADGTVVEELPDAPLAYDVLSVQFLYWDPNAIPGNQSWRTDWDSNSPPGPGPTFTFPTPATVLIHLEVSADERPLETIEEGEPVRTVRLTTAVNLEGVIQDGDFPRD